MKIFRLKTHVFALCFVLLFVSVSCSKDDVLEDDIENPEAISVADEILQLVNAHRAKIGKNPLFFNALANDLAYNHTLYMISQNDISHDDFDDRSDRLVAEENASGTAENVAFAQPTAKAVMTAWLNSPGHRINIEGDYTHIGIAAIQNSSGAYYYTQLFFNKMSANNNL